MSTISGRRAALVRRTLCLCASVPVCLATGAAGEPEPPMAESLKNLPVNTWTKLPSKVEKGYVFSGLVYAPGRKQVLHWGAVTTNSVAPSVRNDVLAFDVASGDWVSDYPSDPNPGLGSSGVSGAGAMLPSGRPRPSVVLLGTCYDTKRDRVICTMPGLMAAYDPGAKTWKDLKAKTIMPWPVTEYAGVWWNWGSTGKMKVEFDGGPPVYGMGTCYDPVNDEVLLFPHFSAKNVSLREATGQITGHYGTFRYSFQDNTWRVVSDTFGSEETKKARRELIAVMAKTSAAMDAAWVLNRKPDAAKAAEAAKQMEAASAEAEKLDLPAKAKAGFVVVPGLLKSAAEAVSGGKLGDAQKPARDALWTMNEVLDSSLRVEPEPRCCSPMVYDSKNQCIVLYGGQTGLTRTDLGSLDSEYWGLDDTWVYDCKTRQWRDLECKNRPPRQRLPMLAYDSESGLVLLVTLGGKPVKASIWALDVAKREWTKRDEQGWPGGLATSSGGGSEYPKPAAPMEMLGFDEGARLLLITQPAAGGQSTYALKLDLGKLAPQPAPAWTPMPAIRPQEVAPEDPAWLAKLKNLPANVWVPAKPPKEIGDRAWSNIAYDPIRGWVVYYGGGHSSYQVNDVAVYSVGANRWSSGVGTQCDFIPPVGWEGCAIDFRGGSPPYHKLNGYVAFDGRVFHYVGTDRAYMQVYEDPRMVRFYDIGRGGVWRELPLARVSRTPESASIMQGQGGLHMVDPAGRILTLLEGSVFRCYDIGENSYVVRDVPAPRPGPNDQSRSFCYVPGKDQILWVKHAKGTSSTWLYDIKENKFAELKPKHEPAGLLNGLEYVPEQNVALGVVAPQQQWVYSFEKNDWAPLTLKTEGGSMTFVGPYSQMVYAGKHGVFVNYCPGATWLMRPDFSQVKWE
jgi:hypothetical protein